MSGDLRFLYEELINCESSEDWIQIFKQYWNEFKTIRAYYDALKLRRCVLWPEISDDESWDLYSVSRVNDILLTSYQHAHALQSKSNQQGISFENYAEFFEKIGFKVIPVEKYNPFYCEIYNVIQEPGEEIEIIKTQWPALMLGNMLFSRAGVIVKAPAQKLLKGIADTSCLYWTFKRDYRKTHDRSMGWGHNSQWRTSFRRDFDLGDRFIYNADAKINIGLHKPTDLTDLNMNYMPINKRIDFLKTRCVTTELIDDSDLFPYDDYYEEIKVH